MKPIFTKKVTIAEQKDIALHLNQLGINQNHFSIFETQLNNDSNKTYDLIAGLGDKKTFKLKHKSLNSVDEFLSNSVNDWKFIQINYNLYKSIYTELPSDKKTSFEFDLITIIVPETVVTIKNDELSIYSEDASAFDLILNGIDNKPTIGNKQNNKLLKFTTFQEYLLQFNKIQNHLKRGDIYEVNYCIPFIIKTNQLNLIDIYNKQKNISPAPFTSFVKCENDFILCASPERFIQKSGSKITCQPMKGTIKKSDNEEENEALKSKLSISEKERAENVMIVDLTRNDLSKIAEKSSITVKELFGIYEFPHVFQMISTIEANIKQNTLFSEILKALFPMGSMTGAPKMNAIKIIDEVESFSRDLFSGSIGYIDPKGDFDFNVVIRSILYNQEKQEALVAAGGAITIHCNAEDEYKECLLKANANLKLLGIDQSDLNLQQA